MASPEERSHDPVFEHFKPWQGFVPAGTQANWLGVHTDVAYAEWSAHPVGTLITPPLPSVDSSEYLEWIDLLDAVLAAGDRFAMVELGAGFGRWTVDGAFAYRQLRPDGELRLVSVEADPTHYRWLREHLKRNRVDAVAIQAAVAPAAGRVMFYRGDPVAWYGQRIERPASWRDRVRRTPGLQSVRAITLARALASIDGPIDLLDLDIQGAEADVLEAGVADLARVRCVHVATHKPAVEARLRALFGELGWECRADVSCPPGEVISDDGLQSWLNPALS